MELEKKKRKKKHSAMVFINHRAGLICPIICILGFGLNGFGKLFVSFRARQSHIGNKKVLVYVVGLLRPCWSLALWLVLVSMVYC